MGCNNSIDADSEVEVKTTNSTNVQLSDEHIKLVRDSWKEMTKLDDFKSHGTLVMIK